MRGGSDDKDCDGAPGIRLSWSETGLAATTVQCLLPARNGHCAARNITPLKSRSHSTFWGIVKAEKDPALGEVFCNNSILIEIHFLPRQRAENPPESFSTTNSPLALTVSL
jgi:hypothetical protein